MGRPTKYDNLILQKAERFFQYYLAKDYDSEDSVPFLEELALVLQVDTDTIYNWCKTTTNNNEPKYPEFFGTIKKLKMLQKLRLQQRCLSRWNPKGAIFLLRINHKEKPIDTIVS